MTFGNANQTTKNDLPAQYLVSKDLDPILLREHPPLYQRELYYHGFNNIITKQNSWHRTENNTQSLSWHIGKTCTFMHNFISLHSNLLNSWALQLPAFLLSSWAIGATKEQTGCTCTYQQKKRKGTYELLDSSMKQLLFLHGAALWLPPDCHRPSRALATCARSRKQPVLDISYNS